MKNHKLENFRLWKVKIFFFLASCTSKPRGYENGGTATTILIRCHKKKEIDNIIARCISEGKIGRPYYRGEVKDLDILPLVEEIL